MILSNSLALFVLVLASISARTVFARHHRAARTSGSGIPVSVPQSPPADSPALEGNFISLSIEGDRWPEWVGTSKPNTYYINLLKNLRDITGRMPDIRVGADSEDHTFFDKHLKVTNATFPLSTPATPYPEAAQVLVGDKYYALSKWLPAGTHVVWGVNLLSGNVTNAVAMAKSIVKAFSVGGPAHTAGVSLDAIQIGNEPDLYVRHGFRPSSWNISSYVEQWESFAKQIIKETKLKPHTTPRLWLGGFSASNSMIKRSGPFNPQLLFTTGILQSPYANYFDTFSQHHYQSSVCADAHGPAAIIPTFMDKSTIRGNISEFDSDIRAVHSHGLDYILGETNSISCHGAPGVSNTAAAAIWMIDYSLQCAVHGIKRLYFHDGIGYRYNLIQPVHLDRSPLDNSPASLAPHIQPQYYAAVVIDTLLGKIIRSSTRIAEIPISSTSNSTNSSAAAQYVSGYAAYKHDILSRAVFVNLRPYLSSSMNPRGSFNLDVTILHQGHGYGHNGKAPKILRVRRLKIGHADDTRGIMFAGRSYETRDGRPSGEDTYVDLPYGRPIEISDTEAVLVTFYY